MLTRFINCKHFISNEFNEKKLNLKKSERTVADNLRLEKGLIHEVDYFKAVSYTHLRAHETGRNRVCRLVLEKK